MAKQTRSKKTETSPTLGKGEVTPRQVAFIVDCYLSDNCFSETRAVFRNEASSLLSTSPLCEAPKNILSLEQILNEYVCMKERKVVVEEDRARLDQEKFRVEKLLVGMQEVMNVYNSSQTHPAAMVEAKRPVGGVVVVARPELTPTTGSPAAGFPCKSPAVLPVCTPSNAIIKQGNVSSPITNGPSTRKRGGQNAVLESLPDSKKPRTKLQPKKFPGNGITNQQEALAVTQEATEASSVTATAPRYHKPAVQGSNVAKSLFNQPWLSPPAGSLVPPPKVSSRPNTPRLVASEKEKSVSPTSVPPFGNCSSNTPQEITPTRCTVITSQRVTVSPCKNLAHYSVERNQRVASTSPLKTTLARFTKRECVKGRLDFDASDVTASMGKPDAKEISTSESDKDDFDLDICNLFGANYSFSELLVDLDLGSEETGFSCQPSLEALTETVSGLSPDLGEENLCVDQVMSEFSSTFTEDIEEKDGNVQGPDSLTAVNSMTKCIRVLSPAKNCRSSLNQGTF